MKLWAMPGRAIQDGQIRVESSEKTWPTGEGNGKPLQHSCLENPMNSMKSKKRYDTERWTSQVGRCQYTTGEERRNSSRRNKKAKQKQKQHPVVVVYQSESKVWWCKERYCIGTRNVGSIDQGKLEVVKEIARVNIDILGISELKWMGMGKFNSDDHYIYQCGQQSLRRNGIALMVNKTIWNEELGCNL